MNGIIGEEPPFCICSDDGYFTTLYCLLFYLSKSNFLTIQKGVMIEEINMEELDRSIFWSARRTLTHNKLINIIVGNRGGGKSYGAKQWCIDNFIKKGEQFGYVRRYKDDLKKPMEQFFKDIEWEYPDYEFKIDGEKFMIRMKSDIKQKWSEKDIAGYGFSLSTANNKKSIAYPNITTLVFDEFLLEQGNQRYLPNEPEKLLNLYETIARPGTNHPRVVVFMLANAISITNPYFLYWNLQMPVKQDKNGKYIWKHPTRPILVEDVRNEKFIDKKRNTEFGALVEGTNYAEYSIENKFLLDDNSFIEKKGHKARYFFTFIYNGNKYGVWMDLNEGKMWVSEDIDPAYLITYTLTLKDHQPNTMLLKNKRRCSSFYKFIECYKQGNVYFENMNVKNICYEVIKMTLS